VLLARGGRALGGEERAHTVVDIEEEDGTVIAAGVGACHGGYQLRGCGGEGSEMKTR
jgi:coenzyme F420-reducing hydrogenase gamma subunit